MKLGDRIRINENYKGEVCTIGETGEIIKVFTYGKVYRVKLDGYEYKIAHVYPEEMDVIS